MGDNYLEMRLHVFRVGEMLWFVAYDIADVARLKLLYDLGRPAVGWQGADGPICQEGDHERFAICMSADETLVATEGEMGSHVVTKTFGEWAGQFGRGFLCAKER